MWRSSGSCVLSSFFLLALFFFLFAMNFVCSCGGWFRLQPPAAESEPAPLLSVRSLLCCRGISSLWSSNSNGSQAWRWSNCSLGWMRACLKSNYPLVCARAFSLFLCVSRAHYSRSFLVSVGGDSEAFQPEVCLDAASWRARGSLGQS